MKRLTAYLITTSVLFGCNSGNVKDLQTYVEDVKAQQHSRIDPLPEFAPYETYLYSAASERDPFTPPSSSRPNDPIAQSSTNGLKPDFNRAREPLEAEPLDSLRMVGMLDKAGLSFALVRMSDSTIHRVRPGNYIGQNYGKITRISESEIAVREIIPDGLGGWMERQAFLALGDSDN
jgi:type IV pilus assembly protein PilP